MDLKLPSATVCEALNTDAYPADCSACVVITINGHRTYAVMDTGSQHTLIADHLVHRSQLSSKVESISNPPSLRSADGGHLRIRGVIPLDLSMGEANIHLQPFEVTNLQP